MSFLPTNKTAFIYFKGLETKDTLARVVSIISFVMSQKCKGGRNSDGKHGKNTMKYDD